MWEGCVSPPSVEMTYEEINGFLQTCNLQFDKKKDEVLPEDDLRRKFFSELQAQGVFQETQALEQVRIQYRLEVQPSDMLQGSDMLDVVGPVPGVKDHQS